MAGETSNIAEMAKKLSSDIFSQFGWKKRGPADWNWTCVEQKKHRKTRGGKSHPTDVVFTYKDPYTSLDQYINIDLKSLGASSIKLSSIKSALRSLSQAAECASKSETWQERYVTPGDNIEVASMLFVYNHDQKYDKNILAQLSSVSAAEVEASHNYRLYCMGPERVNYLATLANDMVNLRGRQKLPTQESCSFYYPDFPTNRPVAQLSSSASIESLLGPLLVLKYNGKLLNGENSEGVLVYYDGQGVSHEEFQYLFDFLFRCQLVDGILPINVRSANSVESASANFQRAKDKYLVDYWPLAGASQTIAGDRINKIKYKSISTIITRFSETEIGFENV